MEAAGVWIAVFAAAIGLYLFLIFPRMLGRPNRKPFLAYYYAHRGLYSNKGKSPAAPENSIPAFQKAVEKGYGIELDVQLTKDGRAVIFHDESLLRMCGVDRDIRECTYEELLEYPLKNSKERIPLFQDVLALVAGKTPLIVEIKCESGNTRVCECAYECLKNYSGLYCIESFHPLAVRWFRKNLPRLMRGQLASNYYMAGERKWYLYLLGWLFVDVLSRPDFIAYDVKYTNTLSRRIATKCLGAVSAAWTIKTPEQLEKYRKDYDIFIFEGFEP